MNPACAATSLIHVKCVMVGRMAHIHFFANASGNAMFNVYDRQASPGRGNA